MAEIIIEFFIDVRSRTDVEKMNDLCVSQIRCNIYERLDEELGFPTCRANEDPCTFFYLCQCLFCFSQPAVIELFPVVNHNTPTIRVFGYKSMKSSRKTSLIHLYISSLGQETS